jgi:hypothetical protein
VEESEVDAPDPSGCGFQAIPSRNGPHEGPAERDA